MIVLYQLVRAVSVKVRGSFRPVNCGRKRLPGGGGPKERYETRVKVQTGMWRSLVGVGPVGGGVCPARRDAAQPGHDPGQSNHTGPFILLAPASHEFRPRLHFNPKLRLLPQEL